MISPKDILDFWFQEAGPKKWYAKSDAFDAEIRARYEEFSVGAAAQIKRTGTHGWQDTPNSALALIITLDQFPRNMYRDTKGAFAWDDLALACAQDAIARGHDLKVGQDKRALYYMPFMHAEDIAMQDECVRLMEMRIESESSLFHANAHRKLIADFGRFPHRNEILGRMSTDAEREFLAQGGYAP